MALGRRKTEEIEDSPIEPLTTPKETYLNQGCSLSGVLRFAENVRIEGRVEGEVQAQRGVVVGEGAEVEASIEAESLEVYGTRPG